MPNVIKWFILLLVLCAGLSVLSYASSVGVQVRASVPTTQVLLPTHASTGDGSNVASVPSPWLHREDVSQLTINLSDLEWNTSGSHLTAELILDVRSNVPWGLSAELASVRPLDQLELYAPDGRAIDLDTSATEIQFGELGIHTLYLLIRVGGEIPQEKLDTASLTLQLRPS